MRNFYFYLLAISIIFYSCSEDDSLPILKEDMSVFLSAMVDENVLEMKGETLVISECHLYPDFEAWQINITGATSDGKKLALYIKYYENAGLYYTGSIGSRNWMYYSEIEGEEYGTIPVWWEGEGLFIEEQDE